MKTSPYISFLAFALFSACASAQDPPSRTLDDVLTQDQGMLQISDGFYARTDESSRYFVAVNATGRKALLQWITEERDKVAARFQSGDSQAERSVQIAGKATDILDHAIAELNRPDSSPNVHRLVNGDCTGAGGVGLPALYIDLASNNGRSAGGYAGITTDSNPPTPTTNYVAASTYDTSGTVTSSNTATTTGAVVASAGANVPQGLLRGACYAVAEASVTCPGQSHPAITAVASSWANQPDINCL